MDGTQIPMGLAFLAGFASFISPCVLSLVPAYVGYLSSRAVTVGEGGTMTTKAAEDQMAPKPMLMLLRDSYIGDAGERHPLVSPIYADLKGIAPLLILVGSAETLLDDALRLAGAAGAAEIPVHLEIWPEMIHVWPLFHQILAEGRQALVRMGEYIRQRSA